VTEEVLALLFDAKRDAQRTYQEAFSATWNAEKNGADLPEALRLDMARAKALKHLIAAENEYDKALKVFMEMETAA